MMEGLAGWLKQVVAVVLLAGLVDLLLPNRTMQRYVRLIAGLLILLTIATPLLQWLRGDFGSRLAKELGDVKIASPASAAELSRIEAEGRKLRERRLQEASDLAAARLQEAIRADVERSENRKVRAVRVDMQPEADGTIAVRDVIVELEPETDTEGSAGKPGEIRPVEPVAPVTVERTDAGDEEKSMPVSAVPASAAQIRIAAFIAARYGLPADRVEVVQAASQIGNGR